jgi:diacylglycerol O-acyltransferase
VPDRRHHEQGKEALERGKRPARSERLRPNDVFFLHAETAGAHQHVGGLAVLERRSEGPVPLDELLSRLTAMLGALPRLRQRLAYPWGGLARPAWVDVVEFDLRAHVHAREVAEPGRRSQLEDAVAEVMAQPLDRSRPLWEIFLLNGLADGQQAVLIKLHHAIADGIGALALAEMLLDQPGEQPPSQPWIPSPAPDAVRLFSSTLAGQVAAPWQELYGAGRRAVEDPRRAWRQTKRAVNGIFQLARAGPASPTGLNRTVQPARRVALADAPLEQVRTARRHHGGTDNDVVLAAVSAGLHEWFGGEAPDYVRTMVPVSTRRGRKTAPGTWTATLDVDLPVGAMSPSERLRAVTATTRRAKRSNQALGSQLVMGAVGTWAPPFLHARFAHFAYRGRWFNLIVSSVPGPRHQRSLAGAAVSSAYPIIPLAEQVGLTVAALTWGDQMTFGLTADPTQIDDLAKISETMLTFIRDLASTDA